jgi:hypothetical protein
MGLKYAHQLEESEIDFASSIWTKRDSSQMSEFSIPAFEISTIDRISKVDFIRRLPSSVNFIVFQFSNQILSKRKEELYQNAIKNLMKKSNYLNLHVELIEGSITEEEFDEEINNNPESYIVRIDKSKNLSDYQMISEILQKIGGDFTESEAENLFGVSMKTLS